MKMAQEIAPFFMKKAHEMFRELFWGYNLWFPFELTPPIPPQAQSISP